ncbi:MAG TPA: hypothetical protein VFA76_11060 [Terriglobales bacterium]|nr:hypothetical protein [Terriglobales bacterium]
MKRAGLLICLMLLSAAAVAQSSLSLPVGTAVKMKLQITLATFTTRVGSQFYGRVSEPVMLGNRIVIPLGSEIKGHITRISEPRRIAGKPTIGLRPDTVTLPNGQEYALSAVLVDTNVGHGTDVNDEGQFKGSGHDKYDLRESAAGTGGGVVIGALVGGAQAGIIGAGIGAGATMVHWLVKRRSATLPAGTELVLELSRPVSITPAAGVATGAAGGGSL